MFPFCFYLSIRTLYLTTVVSPFVFFFSRLLLFWYFIVCMCNLFLSNFSFHLFWQDMFELIVCTFDGLEDSKSPSFARRVVILETLARYRSCVVMLDLDCNDLINEMFHKFFCVVRYNCRIKQLIV
jgi:hypothetical protein